MTFQLVVLSPEKQILSADCTSVTVPSAAGQITILPHHISLFAAMQPGEIIARQENGSDISLFVGGGFINVLGPRVTVLADFGINSDEIDEKLVQEAKLKAEAILKSQADAAQTALAEANLSRSLIQLKIAARRRSSHP